MITTTTTPLRYDPRYEHVEEDEAETIGEITATMRKIAETTLADSGHAMRSVHAKSHGVVEAEIEILGGLPPVLAQGLFAQPGKHPVVMRLSTSPGDIMADSVSTPRGLGLKVLGVDGDRLAGSEGDATQDFVMVDGPAFFVPTAKKFAGNLKLLAASTDKAEGLKKALSSVLQLAEKAVEAVGSKSGKLVSLGGHAETNILGETFYTQTPLLYGDYMAKFALKPVSPGLTKLTNAPVELADRPNGLRDAVLDHFSREGGEWHLMVQLCTDVEAMPIEDPTVEWPQDKSPYVAVARVVAKAQKTWDAQRSTFGDDRLAFSPWHGLAAHRPLGAINRVRKSVYEASKGFRGQHAGCPIHEPRDLAGMAVASSAG